MMLSILRVTAIAVTSAALMGSLAATAVGPATAADTPKSRGACPQWDGVQPHNGANAFLSGVAMLPTCQAWAVGTTNNPPRMLIEELIGSSWIKQVIPVIGSQAELASVTATAPDSAWAVGSDHPTGKQIQGLIIRWNGGSWTTQTTPALGHGAVSSLLSAVAASSASNAWAVGNYGNGKVQQTLILHWNGIAWKEAASPDPSGAAHSSKLTSVTVISRDDAWAAGYYRDSARFAGSRTLILHWNGKTWSQVPSPTPTPAHQGMLFGITATSPRNAWAVGYTTMPNDSTLVLHWNGRAWSQQRSPNPPNPNQTPLWRLFGVSATSASNAWAVGYQGPSSFSSVILHWNGRAWRWVSSPSVGGDDIPSAVTASPAGGAWAVGFYHPDFPLGDAAFTIHWNGTTWQQ